MKVVHISFVFLLLFACDAPNAQTNAVHDHNDEPGKHIYETLCASCHGTETQMATAPSLFDNVWEQSSDDLDILSVIKTGLPDMGMPAFGENLSVEEQTQLLGYLRSANGAAQTPAVDDVPIGDVNIQIEDWVAGLDQPWGFVFTGKNDAVVTEKGGALRLIRGGALVEDPVRGVPKVSSKGQGGLLDVAIDPDFASNGWIYLAYADQIKSGATMTKIIRGRIEGGQWIDQDVLFEAKAEHYNDTRYHFGSRIAFDDHGHLFFSIGDRGKKDQAQDVTRPNGKIHRINRDGSIPDDNPFIGRVGAYPSIYSYGNRNPQGLIVHPDTGVLWETEHGPKGGDELNAIQGGDNYGWPEISYGRNYNGTELTPYTAKPGMAQPASHWTPSIAVCGLDVYQGDLFKSWKGKLLVGSLADQSLRLVTVEGQRYISEITLLKDKGRIRDVTTGPDGAIYVALPKKIVRLTPKDNHNDK